MTIVEKKNDVFNTEFLVNMLFKSKKNFEFMYEIF